MNTEDMAKKISDALADACEKDPKRAMVLIDAWETYRTLFQRDKTAVLAIDVTRDMELFDASESSQAEFLRDTHKRAQEVGLRAAIFISFKNEGVYLPCDDEQVAFFAREARTAIRDAQQAGFVGRFLWKINRKLRQRT